MSRARLRLGGLPESSLRRRPCSHAATEHPPLPQRVPNPDDLCLPRVRNAFPAFAMRRPPASPHIDLPDHVARGICDMPDSLCDAGPVPVPFNPLSHSSALQGKSSFSRGAATERMRWAAARLT
ncbi:hypothetical protein B0H19DRAFT_1081720 [Mycena capillaripes]|nr:hypothetical protein B0H19DRAFT_1081720 [Mycena capillaripes]